MCRPFLIVQVLHTMSNTSIARASVGRSIPSAPLRILDAPDLVDDYYLNLISWGHNNVSHLVHLLLSLLLLLLLSLGSMVVFVFACFLLIGSHQRKVIRYCCAVLTFCQISSIL